MRISVRLRLMLLIAISVPVMLLVSGCEKETPELVVDDSLLVLDKSYPNQRVAPNGTAHYRFRTTRNGPYLIIISDVANPSDVTLINPKRTCYLLGNGSCELISLPNIIYDFEVVEESGKALEFTLKIIPTDGLGLYEGMATDPVAINLGESHAGRVGAREFSYYRFRTGRGTSYKISVTGVHSDMRWVLFDRWAFDVILHNCNAEAGASDEICQVSSLWPDTDYYLTVAENSGVPGEYSLMVQSLQ